MKFARLFLPALVLLAAPVGAKAGNLSIDLKVNGQLTAEIRLQLKDGMAVATVAGETEQYNLQEMSWLDSGSNRWVTLAQCEAWAQQSKARSLKSVDSAPASMRSFLLWSLDPTFKVEKSSDTLRLIPVRLTTSSPGWHPKTMWMTTIATLSSTLIKRR